jgi:hypothetical protein
MTPELWALSILAAAGVFILGWGLLPDRRSTAPRTDHQPVHAAWRMDSATERLGPRLPGPVADWPWGQPPARFMYDRLGRLTDTLGKPLEWMAAELKRIDREH